MSTTTARPLWSAAEVAARLSVSRATVYRLAEAGLLPGVRVGNQWRFDGAQLEGWLHDRHTRKEPDE
jgi:nitrogen PTS system EIIA component